MGRISVAMTVATTGDGFGWTALAGVVLIVFGVALLVLVDAPRRVFNTVRRRALWRRARRNGSDAERNRAQPPEPMDASTDDEPDQKYPPVNEQCPPVNQQYPPVNQQYATVDEPLPTGSEPIEREPLDAPEPMVAPEASACDLWVTVPEVPPGS
jgi:hypothetical protein